MASARRIGLSTALKLATRINLSTAKHHCKKNRDLSTAVKSRWSTNKFRSIHSIKDRFSTNTGHNFGEIAYTVDVAELLSSPERDFLLNNNGEKVPISSLEGKLVGLYFFQNTLYPPPIKAIKKVYEEAKSRGYDFEVVQINLHYHSFEDGYFDPNLYCEDISWLTVPFMDPSCRKIQRIFECIDDENKRWYSDCLVLIYPCQAETDSSSGVLFEFSGAGILRQWGIEGYPFTRPALYKAEYEVQKREVTLQSLFPPGECLLQRPRTAGDGCGPVDAASELSGKRVLVLFAHHEDERRAFGDNFLSMLKSEYEAQVEDDVAEQSTYEVVYFPTGYSTEESFDEFTKDMPWLVRSFSSRTYSCYSWLLMAFKGGAGTPCAVAFNEQGELIAKEDGIGEKKEGDKLGFPFIDHNLEKRIRGDVERLCPSTQCKKNYDLSTAVKEWRGSDVSTAVKRWRVKGLPFYKKDRYHVREIGYTVDVADLLSTPERDFLIKNNGQKIKLDNLRGKTIVLNIFPLDGQYQDVTSDTWDMIDAYCELLRVGSNVEFVFVPVRLHSTESVDERFVSQEALFNHLFSTMPFPAVPFSDVQGRRGPVVQTFSVDDLDDVYYCDDHEINKFPHWVVIDPTNTVVALRYNFYHLFKLFGGAELHPLSQQRITAIEDLYRCESRVDSISKWDELLASDTRDFLLSSNGDKVPISSLKGKLVGLYFCENIPHPPHMQAIKKVYEEATSRGYDFEIVQIIFHYHPFNARHLDTDPTVLQCREDVSWLTLPFKDPSCRKIQRVFHCREGKEEYWVGDCLALIYPSQTEADDTSKVLFEFSGAEILEHWGIEGYPFTRQSLYEAEYEIQKREASLRSLFPPGECLLRRPRSSGDGFDLVDAVSQLSGKRVLVLFAGHFSWDYFYGCSFVRMLKSEYKAQVEDNVAEESKFEVVYVSTNGHESTFDEFTKDMPWLVLPYSSESSWELMPKVFKRHVTQPAAAAFNEQGELIAKEDHLDVKKEGDKLRFPFIDQDLETRIRIEVEAMCREMSDVENCDYQYY